MCEYCCTIKCQNITGGKDYLKPGQPKPSRLSQPYTVNYTLTIEKLTLTTQH